MSLLSQLEKIVADEARQKFLYENYRNPENRRNTGIAVRDDAEAREWQRLDFDEVERGHIAKEALPKLLKVVEAAHLQLKYHRDDTIDMLNDAVQDLTK